MALVINICCATGRCPSEEGDRSMDGGTIPRRSAHRRGWLRTWSGAAYTTGGLLLTATTISLCFSNTISALHAIGLALPAGLMTLGGLICLLLPGTYDAWLRGFEQGCKVAMTVELSHPPAKAVEQRKRLPPGPATVTDLPARDGRRSDQRSQRNDGI